jgi:dimethyl sulfoxide reductase iron-sulfur subunit
MTKQKHLGMAIDLNRCIGCWTCAVGCKSINNEPLGVFWNRVLTSKPGDLDKSGISGVSGLLGGPESNVPPATDAIDVPYGVFPHLALSYQPTSCQHCENAPCLNVCPVGATFRRDDGVVLVDYERCIGCRYCIAACPYGARVFNWGSGEYAPDFPVGYGQDYRVDDRLVFTPVRPVGVAEKCTFCVERLDKGELPMCVELCPAEARIFGDLNDPESEVTKAIEERGGQQLQADLGTRPSVYYLPADKQSKID